jgi:hypothetical protein
MASISGYSHHGLRLPSGPTTPIDRRSPARHRGRRGVLLWVPVILIAVLGLSISASAASGVRPYQIFWKTPTAPDAILCRDIVFRPASIEDPVATPFCRAFRQFQVIEVRGAWARIGSDVWIETAVLLDATLLQRADPRVARASSSRPVRDTEPSGPAFR